MKKVSTFFLQIIVVLIGIGALAFMLLEPHFEGRNANATFFEIYFNDAFLAYVYLGSLSFFIGLYQAFQVLGYVRKNRIFENTTVKALRTIRYCAVVLIGFVGGGVIFIRFFSGSDDAAGGIFMGALITLASFIAGTSAAMLEAVLRDVLREKLSQ